MLTEKHELPKLPGAAKWKAKIDPTFVPKAPERRRQPPTHPTDSNDAALEVMRGEWPGLTWKRGLEECSDDEAAESMSAMYS